MECIYCGEPTKVVDKRASIDNSARRRRECLKCGKRFTTKEVAVEDNMVTKKIIKKTITQKKDKPVKEVVAKPLSPEKENLINLFKKGGSNGK